MQEPDNSTKLFLLLFPFFFFCLCKDSKRITGYSPFLLVFQVSLRMTGWGDGPWVSCTLQRSTSQERESAKRNEIKPRFWCGESRLPMKIRGLRSAGERRGCDASATEQWGDNKKPEGILPWLPFHFLIVVFYTFLDWLVD